MGIARNDGMTGAKLRLQADHKSCSPFGARLLSPSPPSHPAMASRSSMAGAGPSPQPGASSPLLRFDGRVAVVTGAGAGLGRTYALLLASRGAAVVVNDVGLAPEEGPATTTSGGAPRRRAADVVVEEIRAAGGRAFPNYDSVTEGSKVVGTALAHFGRVDILVNNAGILRDVSFLKMTPAAWEAVLAVHLRGAYACTQAAWPHLVGQGYGRVVMISSAAGLYGNVGQANYAAAKLALVGLANVLALEGAKKGVRVNTVAPIAASAMTATVLPPDLLEALKPEFVAPAVALLCHEQCPTTGGVYELGAGWISRLRWERSKGLYLPPGENTLENVAARWESDLCAFEGGEGVTHPTSNQDAFAAIMSLAGGAGK
jgi:NAD(P)-dependent dehydrogenase (short-subunit alcohol dehydrogenase family)